ncbi:phosphate ABC transporter permease PstA [Halosegnis rubeus]|uniref:Phosphate transport system permease protein PstA n=1 Tax=Halosegnis rubeus TaxID=2212850 RepID=A0A5N5UCU9_9EURY|nr:phosphate ABC transporter permease PstA [Halosegnis rubeus]KAB7516448.1 phosphate ABC transporter permease PstA [Halosegnis rubeus]
MATEDRTIDGFGQVSRTVGTVFRYLLLAATLIGIVALVILLLFVANDAIQPLTADPGWHLTFFATLVVPTLAVGGYLASRNQSAAAVGVGTIGLAVVTTMFAGGLSLIFVDIVDSITWAAAVLTLAVPTAAVVAIARVSNRSPLELLAVAVILYYVSLFGVPGPLRSVVGTGQLLPGVGSVVASIPVLPVDWMLLFATFTLPVAVVVRYYARQLVDDRTATAIVAVGLVAVAIAATAAPTAGITPVPATVLASVVLLPTMTYVTTTALSRPHDRVGLALPGAVFGGSLLGAVAVRTLGYAGPQAWVDWQFLTSAHSRNAIDAGLYPAIGGSILLMLTVAVLSFPLGVGAAIYLEEYAPDNKLTRLIDVNISNLAGVPSVVYGLLGLGVFVRYFGQPSGTVLVGGATLALLILPIVIISSREAIRSVPNELRQASYGMGATRWQTVKNVILPRSFSGVLTGTILALGRAIGETAPLIMIGAPDVLFSLPADLSSKVSAMPLQVFAWSSLYATPEFYQRAVPAGVVVLVSVLLSMNSVAIVLRNKFE